MTDRILLTVRRGRSGTSLVPADALSEARLEERGFRDGDQVSGVLTKARNPRFHRLAHAFGMLVRDNIAGVTGVKPQAERPR